MAKKKKAFEYICTCQVCGAQWVYNDKHERRNKGMRILGFSNIAFGAIDGMHGRGISGTMESLAGQEQLMRTRDYSQCPNCGSQDITFEEHVIGGGSKPRLEGASSADELMKYKNLLDSGALTQQEFDFFKQKLLGN